MNGLCFEEQVPVVRSDPNRADIACFVGFIKQRDRDPPDEITRWLQERGWEFPDDGNGHPVQLDDLPVPAPVDPFTGRPPLYRYHGRSAELCGHDMPGLRYRLIVRFANKSEE